MPTISNTDKKLESFLEETLEEYENTTNNDKKNNLRLIIDSIYSFERTNAIKSIKGLDKSIGFNYFIENYKHHERGLDLFSSRMIEEILKNRENTEALIHEEFSSSRVFINDDPNTFLCNILSKYDTDLSKFTSSNIEHLSVITKYIDYIKTNWDVFEEGKKDFSELVSELDTYYDSHVIKGGCTRPEIYIYLFAKNCVLDDFRKYYIMEDTSLEETESIIRNNDIFNKINNIDDINQIKEMEKIIKAKLFDRYCKKGKPLLFTKED